MKLSQSTPYPIDFIIFVLTRWLNESCIAFWMITEAIHFLIATARAETRGKKHSDRGRPSGDGEELREREKNKTKQTNRKILQARTVFLCVFFSGWLIFGSSWGMAAQGPCWWQITYIIWSRSPLLIPPTAINITKLLWQGLGVTWEMKVGLVPKPLYSCLRAISCGTVRLKQWVANKHGVSFFHALFIWM